MEFCLTFRLVKINETIVIVGVYGHMLIENKMVMNYF